MLFEALAKEGHQLQVFVRQRRNHHSPLRTVFDRSMELRAEYPHLTKVLSLFHKFTHVMWSAKQHDLVAKALWQTSLNTD